MRSTFTIEDKLLVEAKESTGIKNTADVVREGLTALIQREAGRRLAKLGGSQPDLKAPPRRRLPTA